jgi:hypothetical protein
MMELLKNKKKIILLVSVCIFAVSLIYRVTHPYKQTRVDALTYSGDKSRVRNSKVISKDVTISVETPLVKLDLFLNPPVHSREQRKNIFLGQGIIAEDRNLSDKAEIDQTSENKAAPTTAENQIEDDLSSFRSFGYMESNGERLLFLERGKQIMVVRKGDRIEGKYLVKDITKEELTLTVISNNESVHIDLSQL